MSSTDPGGGTDTITSGRLTEEQTDTLRRVNDNMEAILREFDAVLARYGIRRQVYDFSMVAQRSGLPCKMCCCAHPPPSEACCEKCPKPITSPPPPGGTPVA